jgi:SAM-dependent methyltransferase
VELRSVVKTARSRQRIGALLRRGEAALGAAARCLDDAGAGTDDGREARTGDEAGLQSAARAIGDVWIDHPYYDAVEHYMDGIWETVSPYLSDCDFSVVVDLAAGHGRNSTKLLPLAGKLYIVDINEENIEFCRQRFGNDRRIEYIVNDGNTLTDIPGSSVTLLYCMDAMVHFDSDSVRSYLGEFSRILVPGGRGFCHHSNYTANPGGNWLENPHWRNFMSQQLFAHYAIKSGLRILHSDVTDWGADSPRLDCYTMFERPTA